MWTSFCSSSSPQKIRKNKNIINWTTHHFKSQFHNHQIPFFHFIYTRSWYLARANCVWNCAPSGPILEQGGEEAAAAESQRIPTKKRVHDAKPSGLPQRRQVGYQDGFYPDDWRNHQHVQHSYREPNIIGLLAEFNEIVEWIFLSDQMSQ